MHYNASCDRNHARFHLETSLFHAAFPNHCTECGGNGGRIIHDDPSPAGVSLSGGFIIDFDPCEVCVGNWICPQCGEGMEAMSTYNDFGKCPSCGWTDEDPRPGLPDSAMLECECYEHEHFGAKLDKRQRKFYENCIDMYPDEVRQAIEVLLGR